MILTARQLLDVATMVRSPEFAYLKDFIDERVKTCETNARDLSENLTSLLAREQQLGAAYSLQHLLHDFSTHVEYKIKQAQQDPNLNES
jgi:hypothetical protein